MQREMKGGTVYLEEVADLSAACQEAFLETLPALEGLNGSHGGRPRLICGSAQDLEAVVQAGRLREDVYYRTSGVCLRIPPLRQRREDIAQLMNFFLRRYANEFRRSAPALSSETEQLLHDYDWPGNIQELEDAARAIVALGDEQLAMEGFRQRWMRSAGEMGERVSLKQASKAASRKAERELILRALDRTRWNRRRAAEELQISYKALLYKLKQIGHPEYGV
jgi:two-component system response regulator AtoC